MAFKPNLLQPEGVSSRDFLCYQTKQLNTMSKAKLKKELSSLTKEQLVEQILDLYDKNKAVKEFYDFYLNPRNEKELA